MPELQQLCARHGPAVLAFELENRAYFATAINDRGDAFYVYADETGAVLGRFNLYEVEDGTAKLGYRVAEHAAGRGVATAAA